MRIVLTEQKDKQKDLIEYMQSILSDLWIRDRSGTMEKGIEKDGGYILYGSDNGVVEFVMRPYEYNKLLNRTLNPQGITRVS